MQGISNADAEAWHSSLSFASTLEPPAVAAAFLLFPYHPKGCPYSNRAPGPRPLGFASSAKRMGGGVC